MEAFECPVCFESCLASVGRTLYSSDLCGHRMCDVCLSLQIGPPSAPGAPENKGSCPSCRRTLTRSNFFVCEPDVELFEREKIVRRRVTHVLNALREGFESTPLYDDYLERREEIIFELVNGEDDARRRKLEAELRELEAQAKAQQQLNAQAREARRIQRIRDIVKKEGCFYEIVKRKPLGRPTLDEDREPYRHVLESQYASLFAKSTNTDSSLTVNGGGSGAQPLDATIREDVHIPRRRYANVEEFETAGVAGGYTAAVYRQRGSRELAALFAL